MIGWWFQKYLCVCVCVRFNHSQNGLHGYQHGHHWHHGHYRPHGHHLHKYPSILNRYSHINKIFSRFPRSPKSHQSNFTKHQSFSQSLTNITFRASCDAKKKGWNDCNWCTSYIWNQSDGNELIFALFWYTLKMKHSFYQGNKLIFGKSSSSSKIEEEIYSKVMDFKNMWIDCFHNDYI